jgi:hypothetical protein
LLWCGEHLKVLSTCGPCPCSTVTAGVILGRWLRSVEQAYVFVRYIQHLSWNTSFSVPNVFSNAEEVYQMLLSIIGEHQGYIPWHC